MDTECDRTYATCTDECTYSGGARVRVPINSEPEAREASGGRTYASAHVH